MNKTYYAIKNQDTGEYWSSIIGGFGPLDPFDLWGRLDLAQEYIQDCLAPHYPGTFVIEQFTIVSAGIVEGEK